MFKKTKSWDFSKGLVQGFGQKLESFHLFFFNKVGQEKVFDDIQELKPV